MIARNVIWVGVNDREIDLFESQYPVPNGMAAVITRIRLSSSAKAISSSFAMAPLLFSEELADLPLSIRNGGVP